MRYLKPCLILAALVFSAGALRAQDAAPTPAQMEETIKQLKARLEALQRLAQTADERLSKVEGKVDKGGTGTVKLGSATGLKLSGDLRVRWEERVRNSYDGPVNGDNNLKQSRLRQRVRIGLDWSNAEGWTVGAGLSSGADDPLSTNDTYSEAKEFERGDLRLDYAYARHQWASGTSVTLGQQKNPFLSAYITVWDSDTRPVGLTLQQESGPWFATAGGYYVRTYGEDKADALLGALQTGLKAKTDSFDGVLAVAYYRYNQPTVDDNLGLNKPPTLADPYADQNYRLELLNAYTEGTLKLGEVTKVKVFGEYTQNIGADGRPDKNGQSQITDLTGRNAVLPEANNEAYSIGTDVTVQNVMLGASWHHVEADAVYGPLKDSDFGNGLTTTDVEGWILKAGYNFTKNMSVQGQYFAYERMEGKDVVNRDMAQIYMLDFNYKF